MNAMAMHPDDEFHAPLAIRPACPLRPLMNWGAN